MTTDLEKHTSFPGAVEADELIAPSEAAPPAGEEGGIRARGYWESVWLRLRKDKLALVGGAFIIFLFFVAFAGSPLAANLSGHGPNVPFFSNGGVDANLQPAPPMSHVQVLTATGTEQQLLILGGDSTLGRDEFLRLLYGAQVSLEVGVGATIIHDDPGAPARDDGRLLPRPGPTRPSRG